VKIHDRGGSSATAHSRAEIRPTATGGSRKK
jgi:hypothetical protein